jgi:hypothetical protein
MTMNILRTLVSVIINCNNENAKLQCIICNEVLAKESYKPSTLKSHLQTKHAKLTDKPLKYFQRRK